MENNKESRGFSAEGRRLRPRRSAGSSTNSNDRGERRSFGERRSYSSTGSNNGERRSYGDRKPSFGGDRKPSYGNGERRSFGDHKPSYGGDRKPSYGNGERRSFGDHKPSFGGDRRPSYGGDRKPSFGGDRRPSFNNGERRSFGENGGERRRFSSNSGERKFQKPFSNGGRGDRFAGKRRFEPQFEDEEKSGISRMISRRPQVANQQNLSDNDYAPIAFQEEMRLNKFIANSGVCSRREADTFIQAGVVTVNGEVVTELGTKVNVINDDIRFNGERLKGEEKVYIVMNKPKGYVTTASDPYADRTVMDLLKGCTSRVFAVGRLDKNTTGVLMFTNDGEMAEKLTHPSYDKKKIYQVMLDKALDEQDYEKILSGITLSDGDVKADELEYIDENDKRKLGIEIHSGKNRIVRRIFESLGYNVRALDRVYFAGLTKKGLQKGEWRYLSEGEVNILRMGAYV